MISLSILILLTTETFYLRSIIDKYTVARIPAGCRFSNRLLTAGKESGGLRLVEDKQVQGPMSSSRHSLHGATNEMKERDGREV